MINRQYLTRIFQRTMTQTMRTTMSAGTVGGLLALTVAVPPVGAQQPIAVRVPASVLERYVGEYVNPGGPGTFIVSVSGDTLFQETSGKRIPFWPLTESLFMLSAIFTAEFVIDDAGGATQILTDGVGFEARLRRKGSPPEKPPAFLASPGVRVPRSVLERYAGVYEYLPGQNMPPHIRTAVTLRGDTLTRFINGKDQVLVPISETRFRVAGTSMMAEFVVDEHGVTQISGSGFQQLLARIPPKH